MIGSSAVTDAAVGTIEPNLRSRLQQLSSTQLEELALALLDFTTKANLVTKVGASIIGVDDRCDRKGIIWAIANFDNDFDFSEALSYNLSSEFFSLIIL